MPASSINKEKAIFITRAYGALNYLLATTIGLLIIVYFVLVRRSNINWDEFHFLSLIYDYQNGRQISALQTFHVHFYAWLTRLGENEIDQIFAARYVQLVLLIFSCLLIYKITRNLFSTRAALFSVFITLSYTDIIRNGYSFRYDTICLFFSLIAISLIIKNKRILSIVSGVSYALALLVSMKSALYIPTFAMLGITTRNSAIKHYIHPKQWLWFSASTALTFITLMLVHILSIEPDNMTLPQSNISTWSTITGAISKTLLTGSLFPRLAYLIRAFIENPTTWFIIVLSIVILTVKSIQESHKGESRILLAFAVPLIYIAFYRNAFSYFYVSIIPLVAITCGAYIDLTEKSFREGRKYSATILSYTPIVLILISSFSFIEKRMINRTITQTEIIKQVHRIFPRPVPYIDRNGMISSYEKVGFFMSSWGMENYRKRHPVMRELLSTKQPKFILANHPALNIDDPESFGQQKSQYLLFDDDYQVLHDNFVRYWGPIYIPGKRFNHVSPNIPLSFEILIPGRYTVEAGNNFIIDDKTYSKAQSLFLNQGEHHLLTRKKEDVLLRWGGKLYKPSTPPPNDRIYNGL